MSGYAEKTRRQRRQRQRIEKREAKAVREHVGRRIVECRLRLGLEQKDLARLADVTNLDRIETGQQNVTILTMSCLARAMGIEVADLFAPLSNPKKRRRHRKGPKKSRKRKKRREPKLHG